MDVRIFFEGSACLNTEAPDIVAPEISGLTPAEVEARAADGLVNSYGGPTTKSVGQIVCEHFFTLFNGVNAVLAGLVAFTGSWRNLSYLVVIFAEPLHWCLPGGPLEAHH